MLPIFLFANPRSFHSAFQTCLYRDTNTTLVKVLRLCSKDLCYSLSVFLNHVKRSCDAPLESLIIRIFNERCHSLKYLVATSLIKNSEFFLEWYLLKCQILQIRQLLRDLRSRCFENENSEIQ